MKNFEILLNNRYSATTQAITSGLDLQNDYYVYINKNGGGIVNQYNVRGYLNDPRNQQITTDFFAFLTGSTTQDQALNILTSDKKLTDTFNDYYQRIVLSSISTGTTAVIDQNLTGTTQITAYTFDHPWSGYAPDKQLTGITQEIYDSINDTQSSLFLEDFTTEQSYYIPVYIERGTKQLSRYQFDICDVFINKQTAGFYPNFSGITNAFFGSNNISNIISDVRSSSGTIDEFLALGSLNTDSTGDTRIHTLLNCFVDINLETNEAVSAPSPLPTVSFQFSSYTTVEGGIIFPKISLNAPSVFGIEEIIVDLFPSSIDNATTSDYLPFQSYPLTLTWAIGEQDKFLPFILYNDLLEENTEFIKLGISNLINVEPGSNLNTSIEIVDNTVLRKVKFDVDNTVAITPGSMVMYIKEGNSSGITISLDGPAFGGETVDVVFNNSVFGNPLASVDYEASITFPVTFTFAAGEISKQFNFSALTDSVNDGDQFVSFTLTNPLFCAIDTIVPSTLTVILQDSYPTIYYASIMFDDFYVQYGNPGGSLVNPTDFRYLSTMPGETANELSSGLRFKNTAVRAATFNPTPGPNGYNLLGETFYEFKDPNLSLKVTNSGLYSIFYAGSMYAPGDSFVVSFTSGSTVLSLPSNDGLDTSIDALTKATYGFEFTTNYSVLGSSFKSLDNNTSASTNTFDLGNYSLDAYSTEANSTLAGNMYHLYANYIDAGTGRNLVFGALQCASTFYGFREAFPENIKIRGLFFLDFNSKTTYDGFEIKNSSGLTFTTTCGSLTTTTGTIETYTTIPFLLNP